MHMLTPRARGMCPSSPVQTPPSAPSADLEEDALEQQSAEMFEQAAFDRGVELFKAGDFDGARRAFERNLQLDPYEDSLAHDYLNTIQDYLDAPPFEHRSGALGSGNDLMVGDYSLAEAKEICTTSPGAVGFTFCSDTPSPAGRVRCYFKSILVGNSDSRWHTYLRRTPAKLALDAARAYIDPQQILRSPGGMKAHSHSQLWRALETSVQRNVHMQKENTASSEASKLLQQALSESTATIHARNARISDLMVAVAQKQKVKESAAQAGDVCSICLDPLRPSAGAGSQLPLYTTECGHEFHHRCIAESCARRHGSCPLCRASVVEPPDREVVEELRHQLASMTAARVRREDELSAMRTRNEREIATLRVSLDKATGQYNALNTKVLGYDRRLEKQAREMEKLKFENAKLQATIKERQQQQQQHTPKPAGWPRVGWVSQAAAPSSPRPYTGGNESRSRPRSTSSAGAGYGAISSSTGRARTNYMSGYTRANGTVVKGYYRS